MNPSAETVQAVDGLVYQRSIAVWAMLRLRIWRSRSGKLGPDILIEMGAPASFAALQRSSLQP